jgi:thiol-disulfide isomerase/thioredoxin
MNLIRNINIQYLIICILVIITGLLVYRNYFYNTEQFNDNNNQLPEDKPLEDKQKGEIVLYYATWCGYSRQFLPEWEKFSRYASKNLPNVKVTSMKCENDDEELCFQKGVEGYPTVILYPTNGTEAVFDKERTSDKLIEFVKDKLNM